MNSYAFTPPALLLAALSGLMGGLALYAFRRRHEQPGILHFVGLMVALAWWIGGLALELSALSPQTALFWAKVEYLGISFIGPFWFLFAFQYAEHHRPLPRWLVLVVLGSGFPSLLGVWTNDWHHLWWAEVRFNRDVGPLLAMNARYGPLFWAHAVLAYGYVLAGDLLYLAAFLRAGPLYRYQAGLMLVAAFLPFLSNVAYVFRWVTGIPALLLTAFSYLLVGGIMIYGLLRYRLLEVLPIARWAVVDHLPDGILVVDPASRVVDLNPAARRLGGMVRREPLGEPLEQAIQPPSLAQALAEACRKATARPVEGEVRLEHSTGPQVLHYTVHPFHDRRGRLLGRILILRDITARVQAEDALRQRSEELDAFARTIAHDLKAPLATVRGYVGVLSEDYGSRLDEEGRYLLARVEEGANRMARMIEDLLLLARASRVEG
ncbi:MAG: PAS domain-containing protein, partial [Chloroflexi bacterium]